MDRAKQRGYGTMRKEENDMGNYFMFSKFLAGLWKACNCDIVILGIGGGELCYYEIVNYVETKAQMSRAKQRGYELWGKKIMAWVNIYYKKASILYNYSFEILVDCPLVTLT